MQINNDFIITIDTDWAPDFAIQAVADKLIENNVSATWFITHMSPAIQQLQNIDYFELGMHPNFLPNSSHGSNPDEVLSYMKQLVPGAISTRSHAVVQSGPLLQKIVNETPIKIDSSIFLPDMPYIQPVKQQVGDKELMRVPFIWSDDHELIKNNQQWTIARYASLPGLKVMLFHPLQIFLNQSEPAVYSKIKKAVPRLANLDIVTAKTYVNQQRGVGNFFEELVLHLRASNTKCLKDLLGEY